MNWNEKDHPRDNGGKFAKSNSLLESKSSENDFAEADEFRYIKHHENMSENIVGLLGEEFTGVRGQDAIEKLHGHLRMKKTFGNGFRVLAKKAERNI